MHHGLYRRTSASMLLAIGFVVGVVFIVSCGSSNNGGAGGDNPASAAADGSKTKIHTTSPAAPMSFLMGTGTDQLYKQWTFTPANPNDVILGAVLHANFTRTAGANPFMELRIRATGSTANIISTNSGLTVGNTTMRRFYTLNGNFLDTTSPGAFPAASYEIALIVDAAANADLNLTNATVSLLVQEDVAVSDPSPMIVP